MECSPQFPLSVWSNYYLLSYMRQAHQAIIQLKKNTICGHLTGLEKEIEKHLQEWVELLEDNIDQMLPKEEVEQLQIQLFHMSSKIGWKQETRGLNKLERELEVKIHLWEKFLMVHQLSIPEESKQEMLSTLNFFMQRNLELGTISDPVFSVPPPSRTIL